MAVSFDTLKPIRCPANIIRQQWENNVQKWENINQGAVSHYDAITFMRFANYQEYDAGVSYVVDYTGGFATTTVLLPSSREYNNYPTPDTFVYAPDGTSGGRWNDANKLKQIVGLLSFDTVRDYCTKHQITRLSRQYCNSRQPYLIVEKATGLTLNDMDLFADWIVPTITWYYTGEDGERRSGRVLAIWYPYTVQSVTYRKFKSSSAQHGMQYSVKTSNYLASPLYAMINAPYMTDPDIADNYSGSTAIGNFRSGYVNSAWIDKGENFRLITVRGSQNPYVTFSAYDEDYTSGFFLGDVTGFADIGHDFLKGIYALVSDNTYGNAPICAYPNAQSVIDYFADFGITLTTNIEEVLDPKPEDDIVNPDTPTDPIPSFPDNKTDVTPIDPAYVTPSTFGSAHIYNPISMRDFLHWISDNTVSLDNWKRLFANPADVIQGINLFNIDLVSHDPNRVQANDKTNILGVVGDVPNHTLLDGYNNIVDGGTLNLMAYYGNYADFTSMEYQCFIPFVGFITVRASDVVNHTLHLKYAVDFATGSAIAFLTSDEKMIYTSPCTVAGKIPLSVSDKNSQVINNTLAVLGGIGSIVGGFMGATKPKEIARAKGHALNAGISTLGNIQWQTNYATRGSLSGVNIYTLIPAFIERTRYDLFLPSGEQKYLGAKYQSWMGAPSTQFDTLKNCVDDKGYVQSDYVVLPSCSATEQEKDEIRALIQNGIYIS